MSRAEKRIKLRRAVHGAVSLAFLLGLAASAGRAQAPNQFEAERKINVEDKDDVRKPDSKIWVLDFKFYSPRLITVDIPGRGRKLCWYLKYQVINNTKEPRVFRPKFELVTIDKPGVYEDQVLIKAQDAIAQIEDPTGTMDFKNSVSIASKPIPVSRPGAAPRPVNGIAIWDDINPEANRFSIFVSGLSNGWSLAEVPPDNKQVVRRKTLQLNFERLGDRYSQNSEDIRFRGPAEWVYRATNVTVPLGNAPARPAVKPAPTEKTSSEK